MLRKRYPGLLAARAWDLRDYLRMTGPMRVGEGIGEFVQKSDAEGPSRFAGRDLVPIESEQTFRGELVG